VAHRGLRFRLDDLVGEVIPSRLRA
jgi:hypothetical protein